MTPRPFAAALILTLAACDITPKVPGADQRIEKAEVAKTRQLKRACASESTYDRLKALAFDNALKVRETPSALLDQIAAATVLRMEDPVVKSRDADLNVTVCKGRMILELPPGVEDAFGGKRRLEADVEYSAQEAVDGSGLVYEMQGAEPIVYRLAAIDFKRGGTPPTMVARAPEAVPTPETGAPPQPIEVAAAPPPAVLAERPAPRRQPPAATPVRTAPPPRAAPSPRAAPPRVAVAQRPAPAPRAPEQVARREPAAAAQRGASRPSFNCRNARSRSERLVCGDGQLARQDRAMSSEFYNALASADGRQRAALRSTRDRFLRDRDRCSSPDCVARAYANRVEEIRAIREE